MKLIKQFVLLVLAVWLVSVPFVSRVGAGSFLYEMKVMLNDPIFVFFQVTSQSRAERYLKQLDGALKEYVAATVRKDSTAKTKAENAVKIYLNRSKSHASRAENGGNYKVGDMVRAGTLGVLTGRIWAVQSIQELDNSVDTASELKFLYGLRDAVESDRSASRVRFASAYERVELVKGIDERIREAEDELKSVRSLGEQNKKNMRDDVSAAFWSRLERGFKWVVSSQELVGKDRYVDAFTDADNASAVAHELGAVLDSIDAHSLQPKPEDYDYDKVSK